MSTISSFIKEIKARLTGDQAEIIAAKNERKANSALAGQIAALKAELVDKESNVEEKEEALKAAKYPTTLITNNQTYIYGIKNALEALDKAIEEKEAVEDSIAAFEKIVEEFK